MLIDTSFTIIYNIIEDGPRIVHLEGSVEDRLKTIKSTLDKLNIAIKI